MPLTAAEERGRAIYAREGCAYCHSQQIRYLEADIDRFARWVERGDEVGVRVGFALSPGLSIEYSNEADVEHVHAGSHQKLHERV